MKIKIGENEYVPPFYIKRSGVMGVKRLPLPEENIYEYRVVDSNGKLAPNGSGVFKEQAIALCHALNELAQLRQERDELQKRVDELEEELIDFKERDKGRDDCSVRGCENGCNHWYTFKGVYAGFCPEHDKLNQAEIKSTKESQ